MKKLLAIALVIIVSVSLVFAAEEVFDSFYEDIKANESTAFAESLQGFKPSNPQSMGMGGAGLAINNSVDALYSNPSILGQGLVRFSVPAVTVSAHHVYDMLKPGEDGNSAFSKIMKTVEDQNTDGVTDLLPVVSNIIGTGKGKVAGFEVNVGMIANVFGISTNISDTVRTFSGSVYDDLKISSVFGLGFGIGDEKYSLNLGFSGKLNINAFSKRITVSDAMSMNGEAVNQLPFAIGYGIPFDAALTLKIGSFKTAFVYSDLNLFDLGTYKYDMILVEDVTNYLTSLDAITGVATKLRDNAKFTYTPKSTLNVGFAFDNESSTGLKLALDVVDVLGIKDGLDAGYSVKGVILGHTKVGAEFSLLNLLKARVGINSGYFTVGATFNVGIITLDAAYYWEELGLSAGEKGLDCLAVRFNFGWDN